MNSSTNPQLEIAREGSVLQLLVILRRRWRLLAFVWGATMLAAIVYTYTSPRLYRPQSTLEIRPETPLIASDSRDPALMASQQMWENYYRTQEAILTSPSLIDATIKALPAAIRHRYEAASDPVKVLSDQIDIEKVRTSFVIKVGLIDRSPEDATQVVNTLVALYLEDANRRLRELKSGQVELLSKEALPSIRARIDEANNRIKDFQKDTGFMDYEEHYRLLVEKYRRFDSALTDAGLKKRKLNSELQALENYGTDSVSGLFNPAFHATRSLEPLADQRSKLATELARQEKMLKDKHPAILELKAELELVDEKIREAIRGTLKAIETELIQVEAEEKSLKEDLTRVFKQMEEVGGQKWKYKQLEGDLASAKELYSSYLKKHGETSATSGATLDSVRIIDHATVPSIPFKPRVFLNLALAAVVGILVAAATIFVTEQLDDRIASPREIEAFLGLDVIAAIPRLAANGNSSISPVLLEKGTGLPELESFRGLRAEVRTRMESVPNSKVLAVLSAMQSEGKSTVTANLAAVLALEGSRVLILDADLRRPSMLPLIGTADGPGISDVLRGEATIEQAIQRSRIEGVDVIGSKIGISSAAELTGSARLDAVIQYGRSNYDFLLIDSAPVNQVSESALVARRADAAVLVIRELQTGRGSAQIAIKRLKGMGINVLGVVLNCSRGEAGGYGYYYSYATSR